MKIKKCNKCTRILPSTTEYFHKNKDAKDGLHTVCKECRGNKFGETKKLSKPRTTDDLGIVDGKIECNRCNRWLPLDEVHFFKNSKSPLGFEANCKECKGFIFQNYAKQSIIQIIEGVECRKCTKCDTFLPNDTRYYRIANKELNKISTQCRKCENKYYKESGYSKRAYQRHSKTKNFKIKRRFREQKRKSLMKNIKSTLTLEEWEDTLKFWTDADNNLHCAYCNLIIIHPNQEHIIPVYNNGEYSKSNIIPVGGILECACNQSKGKKSLNEFFYYSDSFTMENYLKIKEFILLHGDKECSESYAFLF